MPVKYKFVRTSLLYKKGVASATSTVSTEELSLPVISVNTVSGFLPVRLGKGKLL